MAKATYPCPECGTPITIIGRNRSDADYQASRAMRVCQDCSRAAFDRGNAAAAAAAVEAGLPELQGSEKQVSWAETIRKQVLDKLALAAPYLDAAYAYAPGSGPADLDTDREEEEAPEVRSARSEARGNLIAAVQGMPLHARVFYSSSDVWRHLPTRDRWDLFAHVLRGQDRAHWWIDTRNDGFEIRVRDLMPKLAAADEASKPGAAEQAALEAEVRAEALLLPACELAGQRVAEVSCRDGNLDVAYEVKNDALREVLNDRGFVWTSTVWRRAVGSVDGGPVHRVAQTAHLLLANGFKVRVMDDEARALAVSGAFTPERTKWLKFLIAGPYKGWTRASWARDEDYYDVARRVPGSQYQAGAGVVFPPGAIAEAFDFAERHGFSVSKAARDALAAHEAELAAGVVVDARKPKAKPAASTARPVLTATEGGVDADLLDHD